MKSTINEVFSKISELRDEFSGKQTKLEQRELTLLKREQEVERKLARYAVEARKREAAGSALMESVTQATNKANEALGEAQSKVQALQSLQQRMLDALVGAVADGDLVPADVVFLGERVAEVDLTSPNEATIQAAQDEASCKASDADVSASEINPAYLALPLATPPEFITRAHQLLGVLCATMATTPGATAIFKTSRKDLCQLAEPYVGTYPHGSVYAPLRFLEKNEYIRILTTKRNKKMNLELLVRVPDYNVFLKSELSPYREVIAMKAEAHLSPSGESVGGAEDVETSVEAEAAGYYSLPEACVSGVSEDAEQLFRGMGEHLQDVGAGCRMKTAEMRRLIVNYTNDKTWSGARVAQALHELHNHRYLKWTNEGIEFVKRPYQDRPLSHLPVVSYSAQLANAIKTRTVVWALMEEAKATGTCDISYASVAKLSKRLKRHHTETVSNACVWSTLKFLSREGVLDGLTPGSPHRIKTVTLRKRVTV
jgi:hypothetical protein